MKFAAILLAILCARAVTAQTYEQKVVAAVLMGEAWNQGADGMRAVAEVIHQRSLETRQTPFQVVTHGTFRNRAFRCLNRRTPADLVSHFQQYPDYARVALPMAMWQWPARYVGITRSATHFTRKGEKPSWARGYTPVAVVGAHAFYRLPWIL